MQQGGLHQLNIAEKTNALIANAAKEITNSNQESVIMSVIDRNNRLVKMLPMYEEAMKLGTNSIITFLLQYLVPIISFVAVSFNPFVSKLWTSSSICGEIVIFLYQFVTYSPDPTSNSNSYVSLAIVLALYIVLFISLTYAIYQLSRDSVSHRFTIAFIQFSLNVITFVCYMPSMANFAISLVNLPSLSFKAIIFAIIFLLAVVYGHTVLICVTSLMSYNCIPTAVPFSSFDGGIVFYSFIFFGVAELAGVLSPYMSYYYAAIVMFAKLIAAAFILREAFTFPFPKYTPNVLFAGLFIGQAVSDVLTILFVFGIDPGQTARFFIIIGCFIAACIAIHFVFQKRRRFFEKIVAPDDITSEAQRDDHFNSVEFPSLHFARTALHVGYIVNSIYALDGTLGIAIGKSIDQISMWLQVTSMIAFIPSNSNALTYCLQRMRTMVSPHVTEKMMHVHLINVEQGRTRNQKEDLETVHSKIMAASNEAIEATQRFWKQVAQEKQNLNYDSVNSVAITINDAKSAIKTALIAYPSDPVIAQAYSEFLIEALGKVEKGIIWQRKSGYFNKGFSSGVDWLFREFVRSKPKLLKDKIVDCNGNINKSAILDPTMQTTTTLTSVSADDKLEEDIDGGIIEKVAAEQIQWAKLRVALARATKNYVPFGVHIFSFLRYIAFIVAIALMSVITYYFSTLYQEISVIHYRELNASDEISAAEISRCGYLLEWAQSAGKLYTSATYTASLGKVSSETNNGLTPLSYLTSLSSQAQDGVVAVTDILETMAESSTIGSDLSTVVEVYMNDSINRYICSSAGVQIHSEPISLRSAMITDIWKGFELSTETSSYFTSFGSTKDLCELETLVYQLKDQHTPLLSDCYSQAVTSATRDNGIGTTLFIIGMVLLIVVCFPMMLLPIITIKRSASMIFSAMKAVPPAGATEASMPLRTTDEKHKDKQGVNRIGVKSLSSIFYIAAYCFLFLCVIILLIVSYVVLADVPSTATQIIHLAYLSSFRKALAFDVLAQAALYSLAHSTLPSFTTLSAISSRYSTASALLTSVHQSLIQGDTIASSVYTLSDTLRSLHINDQCNVTTSINQYHDFYKCLGLDRAISAFLLYTDQIVSSANLSSELFANLEHFACVELSNLIDYSDSNISSILSSTIDTANIASMVCMIVGIVFLLVMLLIDAYMNYNTSLGFKTQLILLRHIPPPTLLSVPEISDLLLVKRNTSSEERTDYRQIVFQHTASPILCVGEEFIIEASNDSFKNVFKYYGDQIIGRPLMRFVEEPQGRVTESSPIEDQGAFHMYEKLKTMYADNSEILDVHYPVMCLYGNDEKVLTEVKAFGVRNKDFNISSFVLFVGENLAEHQAEEAYNKAKAEVDALLRQLVPREIEQLFFDSYGQTEYEIPEITVVSVQIPGCHDMVIQDPDRLHSLIQTLTEQAKTHPPFSLGSLFCDSIMFTGWPTSTVNKQQVHVAAVEMAQQFEGYMNSVIEHIPMKAYRIGIVSGGPATVELVGDVHKKYQITGEIMDDAYEFTVFAENGTTIIAENVTKSLQEAVTRAMRNGPVVMDQTTFIMEATKPAQ